MNPQERSVLEGYLDRLVQVRTVDKDPEADAMIRRAVRQQPDAAYLVVRRALLLERALDQARARVADLEGIRATEGASFLDPGLTAGSQPQAPAAQRPATSASVAYAPSTGPMPSSAGGASSLLGQVAATAAGVAGGAFLFEGLEGVFGHHGSFLAEQPSPVSPPEDVTINNYYAGADRFDGDQHSSELDSQANGDGDFADDDDLMI